MLDFEAFSTQILEQLNVEHTAATDPHADLYDDFGLDSLHAVQLLVLIESWSAIESAPSDAPEIRTMQDAYDYYVSLQ